MTVPSFQDPIALRIAEFLVGIGIPVRKGEINEPTFFPGVKIEFGGLLVDEQKLTWPGDLLHEAGHLAVLSAEDRPNINGDAGPNGGAELASTAWSFAAIVHLGMDMTIVFHKGSYQGDEEMMVDNFSAGRYIGVPSLQLYGLTAEPRMSKKLGIPAYPAMQRWLR